MKKKWLFSIVVITLFVQLTSCRKTFKNDNSPQNSEIVQSINSLLTSAPICDVAKITYWNIVDTPIAKFSYNLDGNPTMVEFSSVGTDRAHLLFRYDEKRRLSDYISPASFEPNTSYAFWYNYIYDRKNRVLVDTGYLFGSIINNIPQPNEMYKSSGNYEYDDQGRITKVRRQYFQNGVPIYVVVYDYAYDSSGNLVGYGPYDDKVNIHRTNKVWQFIDRNYSMNNPATAVQYNNLGYPLQFIGMNEMIFANWINLRQSVIEYQCHE